MRVKRQGATTDLLMCGHLESCIGCRTQGLVKPTFNSAAGLEINGADKFISAAHDTGNRLVALTFPRLHRVGFIPSLVQLKVLFGQA